MGLTLNLRSDKVVNKLCHSAVAALIIMMERGVPDTIQILPFFACKTFRMEMGILSWIIQHRPNYISV